MLTMRGKIDISKCTFILIYLPFWLSNLVKATNAALHKDSQESKKANKIRYCCHFCGSELTLLLIVNGWVTQQRSNLAPAFEPCISRHYPRQVDYKETSKRWLSGVQTQHAVRIGAKEKRGPRNQTLRFFFSHSVLRNVVQLYKYPIIHMCSEQLVTLFQLD